MRSIMKSMSAPSCRTSLSRGRFSTRAERSPAATWCATRAIASWPRVRLRENVSAMMVPSKSDTAMAMAMVRIKLPVSASKSVRGTASKRRSVASGARRTNAPRRLSGPQLKSKLSPRGWMMVSSRGSGHGQLVVDVWMMPSGR